MRRVNNLFEKVKSYLKNKNSKITRIIAGALCTLCLFQSVTDCINTRAFASVDSYKSQLGTQYGLNSPLLKNEVTAEAFEDWELEVFGIFLSNFAIPFVDSMDSAFGYDTTYGSAGAGAEALQFSCGGDLAANGILTNMVGFILDECASGPSTLYVNYDLYKNGEVQDLNASNKSTMSRPAVLRDLLLTYVGYFDISQKSYLDNDEWKAGGSAVPVQTSAGEDLTDVMEFGWVMMGETTHNGVMIAKPNLASLPTFKVGGAEEANRVTAFSLADGWDSQVLAMCINYGMYKATMLDIDAEATDNNLQTMCDMFNGMAESPLYMDKIGNIVAQYNGKYIIIIPACLNRNLTSDGRVNLVTAEFVNDLCRAGGLDIAGSVSNKLGISGTELSTNYGVVGLGLGTDTTSGIKNGTASGLDGLGNILLYNTSDTSVSWECTLSETDIKSIMLQSTVNLHKNLCVSLIGNCFRDSFVIYGSPKAINLGGDYTAISDAVSSKYGTGIAGAGNVDGAGALAETAMISQMWGVNKGNTIDKTNISFYNSTLGTEPSYILDTEKAAFTSGSVHAISPKMSALSIVGGAAVGGLAATAGVGIATLAGASIAAGPVGWIIGGCVLLGAGITALVEYANSQKTAYIDKVAFGTTLMYMNNTFVPQQSSMYSVTTSTNMLQQNVKAASDLETLGRYCVRGRDSYTKCWDIFAYAVARGTLMSNKPTSDSARSTLYTDIMGKKFENLHEVKDNISNPLPKTKTEDDERMAYSVSVVALGNPSLIQAKKYLCLEDDTTFATLGSYMYLTYLKAYGFGAEVEVEKVFNTDLFSSLAATIVSDTNGEIYSDIFGDDAITDEQKKQRVQEYTYLSLAPTKEGVEYRNQLMVDGIYEWLATEYNKICYGGYTSTGSNGFLNMTSYTENQFTASVVAQWDKIMLISMLIFLAIIIIMGALNGKSVTWFIANIISTVVLLVILPTTGEVTPYVCEKVVQNMFEKGQQYWSISEAIENEYLVKEAAESEEDAQTLVLINTMKVTQTSKYLMVKHDISRKVIQIGNSDVQAIMSMASTRWLYSAIMHQYSADKAEDLYNYVYTSLDDTRGKLKDIWLYYNNIDGSYTMKYGNRNMLDGKDDNSVAGYLSVDDTGNWITYGKQKNLWDGWKDVTSFNKSGLSSMYYSNGKYNWQSFSLRNDTLTGGTVRDNSNHLNFAYLARLYYPRDNALTPVTLADMGANNHLNIDDINLFQEKVASGGAVDVGSVESWIDLSKDIMDYGIKEYQGSGATQEFGYLYMTEDLIPYFYLVVKDTFSYNVDLAGETIMPIGGIMTKSDTLGTGQLATTLLGCVDTEVTTGAQVRKSIMHTEVFGKERVIDILDLETLLTNYVPYIMEVMSITGGNDGTDGVLEGYTTKDIQYDIYGDSDLSWLYRSNWVIKLVTASNYADGDIIRDSAGNTYKVAHSLFPQNYPANRPMVFSEAQMYAMGLEEDDLSNAELACVEANKEVAERWEMLINYVNTAGISREIIEEQMALEATMVFNKQMQPDNYISASMALYPTSLDLRAINFDSIMKLLVISDNYDSASLAQDAIYSIMDDRGIWGGILAWFTALLCVTIIPGLRSLVLAGVFYCAMAACVFNVLNDSRQKARTTGGAVCNNISLTIVTVGYYMIYSLMITRAGSDSILTKDGFKMGSSNITWKLIIIAVASVLYIVYLIAYILKLIRNFKDMGASIWEQRISSISDKIKSISSTIKGKFGDSDSIDSARAKAAEDTGESLGVTDGESAVTVKSGEVSITNDSKKAVPVNVITSDDNAVYINMEDDDDEGDSGIILDKKKASDEEE